MMVKSNYHQPNGSAIATNRTPSQVNQELEQFLTHHCKDGLREIVLLSEEMVNHWEEFGTKEYVGRIKHISDMMLRKCESYYRYHQLDQRHIKQSEINVAALINSALEHVGFKGDCSIEIPDSYMIIGDRSLMSEVLMLIIQNAIEASSAAGLKLRFYTNHYPDAQGFSIQDNGSGIDPVFHQLVFMLFEKLPQGEGQDVDPPFNHLGVGLAMAKKIMELHRGNIWFTPNVDNQGTTFHLSFPACEK